MCRVASTPSLCLTPWHTVHPAPAPPPPQLSPRLPRPTSDPTERPALALPASQQVLSQASRSQRCVVRTGALVTPVRKQAVEGVGSRNTCYSRKTFTILGNKYILPSYKWQEGKKNIFPRTKRNSGRYETLEGLRHSRLGVTTPEEPWNLRHNETSSKSVSISQRETATTRDHNKKGVECHASERGGITLVAAGRLWT